MNMTLKTSEETYVQLMKNIEEVIAGNNTKEIEIIDGGIAWTGKNEERLYGYH